MIKRYFARTRQLAPGAVIDQSVIDRSGRILIARGTALDSYLIEALLKLGITRLYIREGEEEPEDPEKDISPKTLETIEKLKVPDRSVMQLSQSVKERVSAGVQYLYSNISSEAFSHTANQIADNLMKAIADNNALAIDISELKLSDEYTFQHSVDVATMAMIVAKRAGMTRKEIHEIALAGLLHDLGKTKIPNEILNKAGRLTEEEFELMKLHPLFGYQILQEKGGVSSAICLGVLQHHEKISGEGYPMGLASHEISPYAKILSVTDVYDALVTERPYKKAFTQRDAIEIIMSMTPDLDIEIMKDFLGSMILYPVGSTVELSCGERACVVANTPGSLLRPKVVGLKSGTVYDLGRNLNYTNIIIL